MGVTAITTGVTRRGANRVGRLKAAQKRRAVIVSDLWEGDLLVTFTSLFIILVLVLTELSASIGAKTVKMSAIC